MKYVQTLLICIGTWLVAAFVNAVLCAIVIVLLEGGEAGTDVFGLSLLFSFLFSAPLAGLLWLVTVVAQLSGQSGAELFRTMLVTTVLCALTGAVFFLVTLGGEFKHSKYAVACSAIIAAVSALLLFRNFIRTGIAGSPVNHQNV